MLNGPIPTILIAALGIYGGYVSGKTETTEAIKALSKDVAALNSRMDGNDVIRAGRTKQYQCAVRTLDRLTERTKIAPPCALQDGEQ